MIINAIRRIVKEDLDRIEKTPKWVDALLAPLNTFIETTTTALINNLTLADNVNGKQVTVGLKDGVELAINPSSSNRVTGVLLLSTSGEIATGFGWRNTSDSQIGVTVRFATSGVTRTCLLQFLF